MSAFIDKTLVALSDPVALANFVAPSTDLSRQRIRALLRAVYDFPFGVVHDVRDVQVSSLERIRPLFFPERTHGQWQRTIPTQASTHVSYETTDLEHPVWIDLSATVRLTLVIELDQGDVQSTLLKELDGITSLADFQSRFRFLDLGEFLARHRIATVEELREAYRYLLAEIRLKPTGPFNPVDPANQHQYTLDVAVLIRDDLDVPLVLREVKLVRLAAERSLTYPRQAKAADVRTPFAPLVVLPTSALTGRPFNEAAIHAFFAAEGIEIVFQV
jgi:hypothetical protein